MFQRPWDDEDNKQWELSFDEIMSLLQRLLLTVQCVRCFNANEPLRKKLAEQAGPSSLPDLFLHEAQGLKYYLEILFLLLEKRSLARTEQQITIVKDRIMVAGSFVFAEYIQREKTARDLEQHRPNPTRATSGIWKDAENSRSSLSGTRKLPRVASSPPRQEMEVVVLSLLEWLSNVSDDLFAYYATAYLPGLVALVDYGSQPIRAVLGPLFGRRLRVLLTF